MNEPAADLILYNGNVLTLNRSYPRAQLVAILNGKVMSVSDNESIKELKGRRTRVIDLQGKTVMPGFNDAHCHLVAFAESLVTLNLSRTEVRSISEIQAKIRNLAGKLPAGSWIRGGGYNEFYLAEKRHPTRWELDEATNIHPVKLTHQSGHAQVLNSPGLELTGISGETPEPAGGMIERDLVTGEPNGLLYGMGRYLADIVPPLKESELEQGVKLASAELLASGISSVQDASPHNDSLRRQKFEEWQRKGYLKPRVTMMPGLKAFRQFHEEGLLQKTGDRQLRLGAVKIMLDETTGQLNPPQNELNQKVLEIHQAGFQVALHAIEENTIEAAVTALEYALRTLPRKDHRHRIEHCSVCTPDMVKRLASLEVVVVTQPSFIYYSGERYLGTVPDEQRKHLYPIASLMKAGLKVGAGSDCPVVPPDPLHGIYAAVSRKAETGQSLLPEESIPPLEALEMYTESAAYAGFEEARKGSIVAGKLADIVVLSGDPTAMTPDEMKDLKVVMTIVGGEIVRESPSQAIMPLST